MFEQEIWKDIDNFTNYKISNLGNIYNKKLKRNMKTFISQNGYITTNIKIKNHQYHLKNHKIVAQMFINNPNNYPCVNHIDGNKLNNKFDNLEWCTYSENMKHAVKNNLYKTKYGKSKINQYDLNNKFIKIWDSIKEIEDFYNVSHTAIRYCCIGKMKTCKNFKWKYADDNN